MNLNFYMPDRPYATITTKTQWCWFTCGTMRCGMMWCDVMRCNVLLVVAAFSNQNWESLCDACLCNDKVVHFIDYYYVFRPLLSQNSSSSYAFISNAVKYILNSLHDYNNSLKYNSLAIVSSPWWSTSMNAHNLETRTIEM